MARTAKFSLIRRLSKPQYLPYLALVLGFVALTVALPLPAYAQGIGDSAMDFFAQIFLWFATIIGHIATTFIGILVQIVQYNDFINAPAVVKGWVVVRDVANMFFIVILLLIAFGSVFRLEEYQYKHHLSKLLLMAVLINFSKSIAGFMIDFAQVVMLTFVNGFKDAAAGNFITGFQLDKMFSFAQSATSGTPQGISGIDFLAASVLALVTISIATVVVGVYIVVFTLRIVMLWLLIIISPLAYLLAGFPGDAKKYSSQWWDYFGKYVSSGPILAFFLWLSLAVMQLSGGGALGSALSNINGATDIPAAAITGIGQSAVLLSFIISIMLLLGGLWLTQQLGVMGGHLAGAAFDKIQKAGGSIAKAPFRAAGYAAGAAGGAVANVGKRTGFDVATSALGGLARVPLIGNAAIRMRSKLVNARKEGEHHDVKGMENLTDESAALIVQRRMDLEKRFGPAGRLLLGEKGRNQAEYALQWMMKKGQDNLSPKARKTMEQVSVKEAQLYKLDEEKKHALEATETKVTTTVKDKDGKDQAVTTKMNQEELRSALEGAIADDQQAQQAYDASLADKKTQEGRLKLTEERDQLAEELQKLTDDVRALDRSRGGAPPLMNDPRRNAWLKDIQTKTKQIGEKNKALDEPAETLRQAQAVARAKAAVYRDAIQTIDPAAWSKVTSINENIETTKKERDKLNEKGNDDNRHWWSHALDELDTSAGRVTTVQNNDVYLYDDIGQLLEKFRFLNPHLIDRNEKRVVTDPSTPEAVGKAGSVYDTKEFDYRTRRLGTELLRQLPLSAAADTPMVMKLLASSMSKLGQVLTNRSIRVDVDGKIYDPNSEKPNDELDDSHRFQLLKAPFYALNSLRLNESPRKVGFIDDALRGLIDLMRRSVTNFAELNKEEQELMQQIPESVRRAAQNEMFSAAAFQDRLR